MGCHWGVHLENQMVSCLGCLKDFHWENHWGCQRDCHWGLS